MSLIWPRDLFRAAVVNWRPSGGLVTGGSAFNGVPQRGFLGGGPYWKLTLGDIHLLTRAQLKTARALEAALDQGAAPIDVGPCDCQFSPLPGGAYVSVSHSDASAFSDDSLYEGGPMEATFGADAALRAAWVDIAMLTTGMTLEGGEHFSVDHPNMGRRMYRIFGVDGTLANIRPLLREAVSAGDAIDFNKPSCLMALASPDAFQVPVSMGRFATVSAEFVEWFGDID